QLGQAFGRDVPAGIGRTARQEMAVGPLVVARRVDERVPNGLEEGQYLGEVRVGTGAGATGRAGGGPGGGLGGRIVHHERQVARIEVCDQVWKVDVILQRVGEVPDQAELEGGLLQILGAGEVRRAHQN